jgi:galactokinase
VTQTSPKALATSLFQRAFASHPAVLASAPGRVNLIGEHMDYNGGPVLPFAIQRRTVVAASLGTAWQAISAIDGTPHLIDPTGPAAGGWTDYFRGVIRALAHDGLAPRGAQVAVASTVPVGAGLASSAALTVALTRALVHLAGRRVPPERLADIAQVRLGEVERLLPPPWMPRARHVITEASRTREAVHALQAHDLVRLGRLLQEGHRSLRDDYQSSCREADWLVDGAVRHGAYGARLTGAGWGGAVIVLANEAAESRVMALVGEEFNREFGRFPEMWKTSAGRGATVEH